jgi:uncharacterized protein (DUF1499 family)
MTAIQWILIGVGVVVVGGALVMGGGLAVLSRNQPRTEEIELGVQDGRLSPCPASPNCVSSQAEPDDERHYVPPIEYRGRPKEALDITEAWVESREDAEMVRRDENYLRAVFTSRIFRFKDDVEVYAPREGGVLHFRSASRVGQGDMGVNRSRYEEYAAYLEEEGLTQ